MLEPGIRVTNTTKPHILVVDDDAPIRGLLAHLLERHGYLCTVAANAQQARDHLKHRAFDLLVSDVSMPGESGLDLVRYTLAEYRDTAAIMITGVDDPYLANLALECGAYGYIIKPFEPNEVLINVSNALRRRRLEIENRTHRENLEQLVVARTLALRNALTDLKLAREETIHRLTTALGFRDDETAQHIQRMSRFCEVIARHSGMEEDQCELVRLASAMHDVGKIAVPDYILRKPGELTPEEWDIIKQHSEQGYRILAGSVSELLELAATVAWTHHERFDGKGYPRALTGEAIPVEGRIANIADTFDALTSKRAYKPAFSLEEALDLMRKRRGNQFDPGLLDLFFNALDEILDIRRQYLDDGTPDI